MPLLQLMDQCSYHLNDYKWGQALKNTMVHKVTPGQSLLARLGLWFL